MEAEKSHSLPSASLRPRTAGCEYQSESKDLRTGSVDVWGQEKIMSQLKHRISSSFFQLFCSNQTLQGLADALLHGKGDFCFIFYWNVVASQCSVSFCGTAKWISCTCVYIYTHSLFWISFPFRSSLSTVDSFFPCLFSLNIKETIPCSQEGLESRWGRIPMWHRESRGRAWRTIWFNVNSEIPQAESFVESFTLLRCVSSNH